MSLRTVKLPRQSLWPVQSEQSKVSLVELLISPGQKLCQTDPLVTVGEGVGEDIETWPVTCPYAGTVTRVFVRNGDLLGEGTPLCEIDAERGPDPRMDSIVTMASLMGRSTALLDEMLRIAERLKENPSLILEKDELHTLQEWTKCTEWFFEDYGGPMRQYALCVVRKKLDADEQQDAEDLAQDVAVSVRDEWDRGTLLKSYIKLCKNKNDKDISWLFRSILKWRIPRRALTAINQYRKRKGRDIPSEPFGPEIEEPLSCDGDEYEALFGKLLDGSPQDALDRWVKRLVKSLGDREKRKVKYWFSAETRALKDDIGTKVQRYPHDLVQDKQGAPRLPRSIEREWQRNALDPVILVAYGELKDGYPDPRKRGEHQHEIGHTDLESVKESDEKLARAIALTFFHVDILLPRNKTLSGWLPEDNEPIAWVYALRVILRSRGLPGEAD